MYRGQRKRSFFAALLIAAATLAYVVPSNFIFAAESSSTLQKAEKKYGKTVDSTIKNRWSGKFGKQKLPFDKKLIPQITKEIDAYFAKTTNSNSGAQDSILPFIMRSNFLIAVDACEKYNQYSCINRLLNGDRYIHSRFAVETNLEKSLAISALMLESKQYISYVSGYFMINDSLTTELLLYLKWFADPGTFSGTWKEKTLPILKEGDSTTYGQILISAKYNDDFAITLLKLMYEKAMKYSGSNLITVYTVGGSYNEEETIVSIQRLNGEITNNPSAENYFLRAIEKNDFSDYIGAITDINKAVELEPKNAEYLSLQGFILTNMGDYPAALASFNAAAKVVTPTPKTFHERTVAGLIHARIGVVYFRMNKSRKALEEYTKGITIKPEQMTIYEKRAEVEYRLGMKKEADADMKTYKELSEKDE